MCYKYLYIGFCVKLYIFFKSQFYFLESMTVFLDDSKEFFKMQSSMRLDKNKHAENQLFFICNSFRKYNFKIFSITIKSLSMLAINLTSFKFTWVNTEE